MKRPADPSIASKQSARTRQSVILKRSILKNLAAPNDELIYTLVVIPPDGGWGWVVVICSFVVNVMLDGTTYSFGIYAEDIGKTFSVPPATVSTANTVLAGVTMLVAPITCGLCNRYGFRIVAFMGALILAMVLAGSSFLQQLPAFIGVYGVVGGIGASFLYMPTITVVGFYFEKWRGIACSLSVCGSSVGTIIFPIIMELDFFAQFNWRHKFWFLSGGAVVASIMTLSYKPIKPMNLNAQNQDQGEGKIYENKSVKSLYHNMAYPTLANMQAMGSIKTENSSMSLLMHQFNPSSCVFGMSTVFEEDELYDSDDDDEFYGRKRRCRCCRRCCKKLWRRRRVRTYNVNRPMYRDDIFYGASVLNLKTLRTAPDEPKKSAKTIKKEFKPMDYHMSVTRVTTEKDILERCVFLSEGVKRVFLTMCDFSLLKDCGFLLLTMSGFFVNLVYYIPFMLVRHKAIKDGMTIERANLLITGLGIANLIGRIISGALVTIPRVNSLVISYIGLLVAAIASFVYLFFTEELAHYAFVGIYGFLLATVPSLRSVVLVEIIGLEALTNAMGISLLFQGIACILSLPLADLIVRYTGSYNGTFLLVGVGLLLGGIVLIPISCIKKKKKGAEEQAPNTNKEIAKPTTSKNKPNAVGGRRSVTIKP